LALTAQRFGLIKSMAQMQKLLYSDDIQSWQPLECTVGTLGKNESVSIVMEIRICYHNWSKEKDNRVEKRVWKLDWFVCETTTRSSQEEERSKKSTLSKEAHWMQPWLGS
jgi:hypothetical protein